MIPWETTMSCRPFMKTVIFLVLLLCCCLVPATYSRPVDVETPEKWESNNERLEIKPKINNTRVIQEVTEQPEFGSKTSSNNNNKNTSMVVRVIVSSSSSSSSDYDGEFSAFPVSHFTSKTTATTTTATTEEMPSSRATSPRSKITVLGVNRNGGQSTRYFLRPKRISRFTAKSVSSTTPSAAARTTTEDSTIPTSSGEMELNDGDTERITKNSSEDIFSAFYKAFSKSMQENRSSKNKTDIIKLINDNNNDNNSPVMSDSQNVERFQVYPQLIRSRIELAFNNSNSKFNRNSVSYRKTIASIDRHNLRSNNNNNITDSSSSSSSSSSSRSSSSNNDNNNNSETLDESGSGPEAKVVSVVTHSKSVAVNTHRSSKHVITNARPLPVRARPIYQPKRAEMAIDSVTVSTLKNSTPKKSGRSPIITSNSSPVPNTDFPPIFQALIQDIPKSSPLYPTTTTSTTSSPAATSTIPTTTTATTQKSSTSTNSWHLPEKVWGEPAKIWGIQEKVWGEPEKVWGEPAKVWSEPARPSWLRPEPSLRFRGTTTTTSTTTTTIPLSTTVTNNTPGIFSPAESRENKHKKAVQSLEDEEDEETNSPGTFFELGEDEEDDMENDGGGKSSWELPELSPQVDHTFVGERVSVSSINNNNNNKLRSSNSNNNSNKQFGVSHVNARRVSSTSSNSNSNSNSNLSGNRNSNGYNNDRDDSVVDPEKEKSGKKFGYVLEGADVRKYRVEERTPDGYIVGEYGVLNNENGFLRGVRYTADGTINPRLIHEALMKFLAL